MSFDAMNFIRSLSHMGKGMLGIFCGDRHYHRGYGAAEPIHCQKAK